LQSRRQSDHVFQLMVNYEKQSCSFGQKINPFLSGE
jgi:hypothetical protein